MDRSLCTTVLSALYLEYGNPNCCVPVPHALTGDCIFLSVKSSQWRDDKKTKNMGMDISRRKYMICVAEDENPAASCPTDVSFSGAVSRNRQQHMVPVTGKITPTAERFAQIRDYWQI